MEQLRFPFACSLTLTLKPLEAGDLDKNSLPSVYAILGCNEEELKRTLECCDQYRVYQKRKHKTGWRIIVEVPEPLKQLQERLHSRLQEYYSQFRRENRLIKNIHGFVPERSALTNALQHRQGQEFFICDFKNAFGQITSSIIYDIFLSLGIPNKDAAILTRLTTFKESLPQGAPTSPVLLNLACRKLDLALKRLTHAKKVLFDDLFYYYQGCKYTRYADDLCFSSQNRSLLDSLIPEILATIKRYGFEIEPKKTKRLSIKKGAVRVTGLSINSGFPYRNVRLPRRKLRQIRALLHHAAIGERSQEEVAGALGWVTMVYGPNDYGELPQLRRPLEKYRKAVKKGIVPLTRNT